MDIGSILLENSNRTPFLDKAQSQTPPGKDDLKKAAKEFESYFISYLLKVMRESIPKDSLFGGGKGEEMYRSFQDEELAKKMVDSGGIGLTEIIMRDLGEKRSQNSLYPLKSDEDSADKKISNSIMRNNIGRIYENK